MSFRFTVLETSLNRAELRLKWLRLVSGASTVGIIACLVLLSLGGAMLLGSLSSPTLAAGLFIGLGLLAACAFLVVFIKVFGASAPGVNGNGR